MNNLLIRYCTHFRVNILDFKGESRDNNLPTYRHIFYYCVKNKFSNVKLKHIADVADKQISGVGYGVKKIANLITPIIKTGSSQNLITPEMQIIKNHVASFLNICEEYKETDLKLPERE
ncbi:hypothetical protein D0T66_06660 [Dysgonomonas sp. 25]|nr:hypothetical protein [Dysgonomonas sp. 25]